MKKSLISFFSLGVYPDLSESKKLAIQVATFDGVATIVTMLFYLFFTFTRGDHLLAACFVPGIFLMVVGLRLLNKRHYDIGRYLLHLTAVAQIFVTGDATGSQSGFEFYYFTSITVPFVTFTLEEQKKGLMMSAITFVVLMFQQIMGTGLLFDPLPITTADKVISIIIVVSFMVVFLTVARRQISLTLSQINEKQSEIIHSANLKALGEMAGNIAHEINNPLQALTLQSRNLKRSVAELKDVPGHVTTLIETFDTTIFRISKLIKSLRDLTRDVGQDPVGYFVLKEALDDVLNVSSERLKNHNITLEIKGDFNIGARGHLVQFSQVLINLLNNSVDAIEILETKWIVIEAFEIGDKVIVHVTDSGTGIPKEIAEKLMRPFFTTKPTGKGTGLGLSISKSIMEKNGGKLFLDSKSAHTRFVIEIPGVLENG